MNTFGIVEGNRGRLRVALVFVMVAVTIASVGVGSVSAATTLTATSADAAEIGQSAGQTQTVSFDIDIADSETTTVTIDTSNALSGTSTTLSSVDSATSGSAEVTVGPPSTSGGDVEFTVSENNNGVDPASATVDVTLTLDTSGQSTEESVTYTVSESAGGLSDTVTFDLEDTTAPTFDSAITGDSATGSSTARDSVMLSFTESGTGIDAATVDASDFSVTGATVSSTTVNGADEVVLTLDSNLATDATPTVDIGGDGIDDSAGNTLGTGSQTASDGLSPIQTGWAYDDGDSDGTVDFVRVDYSEDVSASTLDAGDWSVASAGDPNLATPTNPNLPGTTRLYLNVSADADVTGPQTSTESNPRLQYAGTSVVDAAGNEAPSQTEGYTDVADPVFNSAEYLDTDGDGQLDRIDITFTELISNSQSTADASDFSLGGPSIGDITKGSLTIPGDGPTVRLGITGVAGETSRTIVVSYSGSGLERNGANEVQTFSSETVDDGAAPIVTDATTLDRDGDGSVDAATLTFTEALSDATVTASEFSFGGNAADAFDTLSSADDDTLQVQITTDANEASGTGAVDVTHTAGTTADAAGNTLGTVAAGDLSETDGAAPVVSGFSLTADDANDELDVSFDASESLAAVSVSITGPESTTLTSFSSGGSTSTASMSVSTNGDYTATLDTAEDAAGNGASSNPSDTATVSFVTTSTTTPTATPVPTAEPSAGGGGGGNSAPSALSGIGSKVRVSGSTGLSEVGVSFGNAAGGTVRASELSTLSGDTPPGTFVTAADITVPGSLTETASTLKFAVSRDRLDSLGVDTSRLTVYRLHDGSWDALETRVVDTGGDTIVVEADTPGFSRFAVMADGSSTPNATTSSGSGDTENMDDTDDGANDGDATSASGGSDTADDSSAQTDAESDGGAETTASQTPGFGVVVALVSLLAFLVVGRRRRD